MERLRATPRERRTRSRTAAWAVRGAVALAILLVGVAIGAALHDNPDPGPPFTQVRTLPPPGISTPTG